MLKYVGYQTAFAIGGWAINTVLLIAVAIATVVLIVRACTVYGVVLSVRACTMWELLY